MLVAVVLCLCSVSDWFVDLFVGNVQCEVVWEDKECGPQDLLSAKVTHTPHTAALADVVCGFFAAAAMSAKPHCSFRKSSWNETKSQQK